MAGEIVLVLLQCDTVTTTEYVLLLGCVFSLESARHEVAHFGRD